MVKVNELVICKDNFKSEEEFHKGISDALAVLLQNNYISTIRWDEKGLGILVIEYAHDNQSYGGPYPYWLMPEQVDKLFATMEEDN